MESLEASYSLLISSLFFLLVFSIHILLRLTKPSGQGSQLPPGPRPLPLIGNILDLVSGPPHKTLTALSRKYGPVMTLKLGAVTAIVVSSQEAAREVLQKNDQALSGRTTPDVVRTRDYYKHSVVWLPPSAKWKNMRRVFSIQMFSKKSLDGTEGLRRKKVDELLDYLHENSIGGQEVDIGQAAFTTVLNLMSNTLFSIDLTHYKEHSGLELKELLWGLMKEGGTPNISDFFPVLRWADPQGARRRMEAYTGKLLPVFDRIINERIRSRESGRRSNDMLDCLLEESSGFSREDINCCLSDLIVAGADTTYSLVEWAMALLLKHPEKMAKARAEIEQVVGKGTKLQESDISKLPYLNAVVKETLRLYSPFLLPHKAETEVDLCGFKVPKDAQIMVNLWAMGRDTGVWEEPDRFDPERFLKVEIDVRGTDFRMIPFGSGRRMCPGMPLANRMGPLLLGTLVHSFEWKLGNGETAETLDMSEKFGITLQKARPLFAIPVLQMYL